MDYLEKAKFLRSDEGGIHHNCAQATLLTFADHLGLDEDTARAVTTFFNVGMRCGAMCGAVSGALMVLGLAGADDKAASELIAKFREKNGYLNCAELLKAARERGEERKTHCDRMVCDGVSLAAGILEREGK